MKAIIILLLSVSMYGQVSSGVGAESGGIDRAAHLEKNRTGRASSVTPYVPLEFAMVASAAFDSYTTVRNVSNGCTERNPLMGRRPSAARVAVFEAGWTAGELVAAHFIRRHHPRIAAVLLAESTIEHSLAGGLNTTQKCF